MNRKFFTPLILVLLVTVMTQTQTKIKSLDDLQWQKRIILVFSNETDFLDSINRKLQSNIEAVEERHISYFLISDDTTLTNYLGDISSEFSESIFEKLADPNFQNKIILIGKDGGIKLEQDTFDLMNIFRLIDSMPMRQREMKDQN